MYGGGLASDGFDGVCTLVAVCCYHFCCLASAAAAAHPLLLPWRALSTLRKQGALALALTIAAQWLMCRRA